MSTQAQLDLQPLSADLKKLFHHVQAGDLSAVQKELVSGISVNFVDPVTTDSPLMVACRKGFTDIVKLCLDYGAKNDPHPDFGQTALHAAVANGHFGCAETILRVAAESDADHIISNLTDQYGQTPLHCAALMGSVPLTELLMRHGARIDCVDSYGQTALHLSAGSVNKACLAVLLDQGGDEVIEVEDVYGNRPLHHAVYHGRLECVKLLLQTAAEVTARNSKNLTPYTLATMQGHHQIGLLLLEYRDIHGSGTPAPTPARNNKFSSAQRLPQPQRRAQFTPPSFLDDHEFKTPLTSAKPELPLSAQYQPGETQQGIFLGMPDFRRHTSNDSLQGQNLPRPHTVGSPSLTNKVPSKRRSSQSSSSAMSSPQGDSHGSRPHSQSFSQLDLADKIKSTHNQSSTQNISNDEFRVIPQLSTPLFSRDVSHHTMSSNESEVKEDETDQQFGAYYTISNSTPSKGPTSHCSSECDDNTHWNEEYATTTDPQVLFTPSRKAIAIRTLETDSADPTGEQQEFADPLEVFEWSERNWHVYMTEQGDLYYLDIANQHSQWEDPRLCGLVSYDASEYPSSLPPDSPSKLLDVAPPLSPALRSPSHISPSLLNSAARSRLLASGEIDNGLQRITKNFGKVFVFEEDEGIAINLSTHSTELDEKPLDLGSGSLMHAMNDAAHQQPVFLSPERPAQRKKNSPLKEEAKYSPKDKNRKRSEKEWIKKSADVDPLPKSNVSVVSEAIASNKTETTTSAPDDGLEFEQVQRYVDMIRAGKSFHDVRLLLESDCRSAEFVRRVLSLADDQVILDEDESALADTFLSPKPKENAAAKQQTSQEAVPEPTVSLDSLKDDPKLSKYVRMAKMGVPPMSVISKLKLDGLDGDAILIMRTALGLVQPKKEEKKEEKKWQLAPEERLKNSIWAFAVIDEQSQPLMAEQELRELEQLFLATPAAEMSSKSNVADKLQSNKPAFSLQLLEGKRAQNITIGLVAFKSFGSHVDVIKAICSLDTMDGKLSADKLENFKTLLPTDAEVKKSFLLKNATHPAEIFVQSALIFYPELPLRLDTFIVCLNFDVTANSLEKRMRTIMEVINQIVSSPKLAKILQKLLVVSKVMMEPGNATSNKIKAKAGIENKQSVLDQLLQVSSTKGVDKKTSVLDYLVKSLYDKNDENLLDVIDDLTQLADNTLPISTVEALQEYDFIQKQLLSLQKEYERVQPSEVNVFSSPTAKTMSDSYCIALDEHILHSKERISYITKRKTLFSKKIRGLMEYFGEDPKKTDATSIFHALKEFRRSLMFSKEAVEWKISRGHYQSTGIQSDS